MQAGQRAQSVADERLLCLGNTDLRRDTREAHTAGRTCTRTALCAGDDHKVGLSLHHAGSDGAHAALGNEFHGDGSLGVDILQIEDQLFEVLDGVDIVMRRRRDEGDTRNGVTCLGNDVVDLVARQLSALTGLGTLCHLDLYLLSVDKVFRGDTETSGSHLLGLTAQADAVDRTGIAVAVLTALTGVAACAERVHGQGQRLVSLLAQGTEAHGTGDEVLDDALHGLHLINIYRVALEVQEVADEDRLTLVIDEIGELLEELVVACAGGELECGDRLGVPGVVDAVLAPVELSEVLQRQFDMEGLLFFLCVYGRLVETELVAGDGVETDAADAARVCSEVSLQQSLGQADGLEDLRTTVRTDRGDAHLGHDLEQSFLHSLDIVGFGRRIVLLNLAFLYQVVENGVGHVRTEGGSTVAQEQGSVHHFADLTAFHDQRCLHAFAHVD